MALAFAAETTNPTSNSTTTSSNNNDDPNDENHDHDDNSPLQDETTLLHQEQLLEPLETTKLFPSSSRRDNHLTNLEQQHILSEVMFSTGITTISPSDYTPSFIMKQFILLSILFSTNHGAVVSCLSLATARMGNLGNWQSSILYLSYTLSSLLGATLMVKSVGSRNAMLIGMSIYCIYVGCFSLATTSVPSIRNVSAILGALVGGIGGGFLWTAQGSYFARTSEEYALAKSLNMEQASAWLGGIFAGIYLGLEVVMRLFSTVMIQWGWSWMAVFVGYTVLAVASAVLMVLTKDYPMSEEEKRKNESQSVLYKSTVTFRLLWTDVKMKYMVPLSATFSLSSVFVTTFVNAEVIRVALGDENSAHVGMFTSVTAAVGGIMSLVFGYASQRMIGNDWILVIGCLSFFTVSFLFVMYPDFTTWDFSSLLLVYTLQGVGRATFEGALKAEFATVFEDKEAAFGNIIFQNGLVTTLGYSIAANSKCNQIGDYCIEFEDHVLHNIMVLEVLVMISAVLAIAGYRRAKKIYNREREEHEMESRLLGEDHLL